MNMNQNSSNLQVESPNNSPEMKRIGCKEIFDKAWLLSFGNSDIRIELDREIESRWAKIGPLIIYVRAERNKFDDSLFIDRYLKITANSQIIHFDEQEIKLKTDESDLFENQLTQEKNILAGIEKRLLITKKDEREIKFEEGTIKLIPMWKWLLE